jgi:quercetin dioxygenase-like cupin family protein
MNDTVAQSTPSITRRAVVGSASAIAVALGLGQRLGPRGASAQDATPTSDPIGIDSVLLGAGALTSAPGTELLLLRTTMAPGGVAPPHIHLGPFVIAVESGTWGYTPQKGSVTVTRAAADGSFTPAEEAMLDAELILSRGDFLFIEDASRDWMRNAGEDEVVLFIAALNPVGQDFGTLVSEMDSGTPTT